MLRNNRTQKRNCEKRILHDRTKPLANIEKKESIANGLNPSVTSKLHERRTGLSLMPLQINNAC